MGLFCVLHHQQQQDPWHFSASSSSHAKRNAFSQQLGGRSVQVDELGLVCMSAMPVSLLLFPVELVESQEQWIWELKVIRMRGCSYLCPSFCYCSYSHETTVP